ncbi:hypothetical protein SteCoe_6913 [Stentor coeruleus]|uniref:RING-CH-type domain-containing protein n=1 Tax=Stentor coeruleus TaxID=5963 RepID=A0A1R2CNP3_9CILI|nr:hypothetical protein SteCoe_6913 [Stentor coeruleus]
MGDQKLKIKALTWSRESSGLFDYEKPNYTQSSFKLTESSYLLRTQEKVYSHPNDLNSTLTENSHILAILIKSTKNFYLSPFKSLSDKSITVEKPWLVVKGLKEHEYKLSEGDVIRLGKVKIKIKEIEVLRKTEHKNFLVHSKKLCNGGLGSHFLPKTERTSFIKMDYITRSEDEYSHQKTVKISDREELCEQRSCRICLSDDSNVLNPLISPCYCTGTMGLVHIDCLQHWLKSKITFNSTHNIKVYKWKSLECELCKFKYPSQVFINDKSIDIISIDKPQGPYIIIETLTEGFNVMSVVSFENNHVMKIGRGHDTGIRLSDISVSRVHAQISLKSNGFFLEDNNSKFGTLVKIHKEISLDTDYKLQIQCGRTLLKLTPKKPWDCFSCLFGCNKGQDSDSDEMERFSKEYNEETFAHNL